VAKAKLNVFSNADLPRLRYILDWILKERFGLEYSLYTNIAEFTSSEGPKINYSTEYIEGIFHIIPSGWLSETGTKKETGRIGSWFNIITLFASNGSIPMDIFSAAFSCISRVEEYHASRKDAHQRFFHSNSILYKLRILEEPIVDLWIEEFRIRLSEFYPELEFRKHKFSVKHTFDIDQAFCYKGKGFLRNAGGLARDIMNGDITAVSTRLKVLNGLSKDPYDTFEFISSQGADTIVFLLLSDYSRYDKSIGLSYSGFSERINFLKKNIQLGIHPSYYSKTDAGRLQKEISQLETLIESPVRHSRQHYLRFDLPVTYHNLISCGITDEYSMGYAGSTGFRAGTSFSFPWFDLVNNRATGLRVHPSCMMDVTLKNNLKQDPMKAMATIKRLKDSVAKVNGTFISIWHNESVSEYGQWKGWREVFESIEGLEK
jgi:hypothetical protein